MSIYVHAVNLLIALLKYRKHSMSIYVHAVNLLIALYWCKAYQYYLAETITQEFELVYLILLEVIPAGDDTLQLYVEWPCTIKLLIVMQLIFSVICFMLLFCLYIKPLVDWTSCNAKVTRNYICN